MTGLSENITITIVRNRIVSFLAVYGSLIYSNGIILRELTKIIFVRNRTFRFSDDFNTDRFRGDS